MPAKKTSTSKSSSTKKKSKSTPKTTESASKVVEPVTAAAVAPVPVAEVATVPDTVGTHVDTSSESIEAEFTSLTTRLSELRTLQSSIMMDLKRLQKTVAKHVKDSNKKKNKKKMADPNKPKREPSGFAKPALISSELCNFLGKPEGTEMARTEVTKYLTKYIKEHNLQDETNRRKILPDNSLQKLLNVQGTDEVTYFNLQKYMKVHFPKKATLSA